MGAGPLVSIAEIPPWGLKLEPEGRPAMGRGRAVAAVSVVLIGANKTRQRDREPGAPPDRLVGIEAPNVPHRDACPRYRAHLLLGSGGPRTSKGAMAQESARRLQLYSRQRARQFDRFGITEESYHGRKGN